ncbi:MAG: hypothetical protein F6K00_17550 [Leptolyngbya sp. SIOISBB]|nr:hypothetical protein [Leptolyngbya sp. SIOISBB]
MVSFRNSQLQAIVFGLVIADAVSQGQLPGVPVGKLAMPLIPGRWSPAAIAEDCCSQAIATQFNQLSHSDTMAAHSALRGDDGREAIAAAPATVADILVDLPRCLEQLDLSLPPPAPGADPARAITTGILAAFDDCLQACLRQDATALRTLQHQLSPAPPAPLSQTGLYQAIECVLAAQGDFQLAVGQSLQSLTTLVGAPILVGMLSASWGDLPSLPSCYRHWLYEPSPELQLWLQRRWQIASGSALNIWAESLWQRWSGRYRLAPGRSQRIAVLPRVIPVGGGAV